MTSEASITLAPPLEPTEGAETESPVAPFAAGEESLPKSSVIAAALPWKAKSSFAGLIRIGRGRGRPNLKRLTTKSKLAATRRGGLRVNIGKLPVLVLLWPVAVVLVIAVYAIRALCYCISNRTTCIHNVRQLAVCLFFIIERMSRSNVKVASRLRHPRS